MLSSLALERPGSWRVVIITGVLLLVVLPGSPLLLGALFSFGEGGEILTKAFGASLRNSALVAALVASLSLVIGLAVGTLLGLYEFHAKKLLLVLVCLPLLVPSFLWALGWSMLGGRVLWIGSALNFSPTLGCTLVFLGAAVALVALTSYAATLALSGSQIKAARLAGGERSVFLQSCRNGAVPALLAASLSGVLTLSDPGPGQVLGLRTGASEVLVSFAAQHDFELAGKQCLLLALFVLALALPLGWFAATRLAAAVLGRQTSTQHRKAGSAGLLPTAALGGTALLTGVAPAIGLSLPLFGGSEFGRALGELSRTAGNTLVYAAGAGFASIALGLALALAVGRDPKRRLLALAFLLAVFSLPPSLAALGTVKAAAGASAWLDPLLRSRFTVCAVLGLRLVPVAAFVCLRAWGTTSTSWTDQAAVSGVSLSKYLARVVLPLMLPAASLAFLLVALLATAEVGTVLLLSPPGEGTFPLAIFTVMANAPEALVASLCVLYLAAATILLVTIVAAASRHRSRASSAPRRNDGGD